MCGVRVGSLQRSAKELRKFVVNFLLYAMGVSKLRSSCLLKHLLFYDFSAKKGKPTAATAFNKLEEICLMRLRYCRC